MNWKLLESFLRERERERRKSSLYTQWKAGSEVRVRNWEGKKLSSEVWGEEKVTEEARSDRKQERVDGLDTHWADSVLSASPPILWKSSWPPRPLHTFLCLRYRLFPSPLSERASSMSLHFLPVSVTEPDPRAHTEDSNTVHRYSCGSVIGSGSFGTF